MTTPTAPRIAANPQLIDTTDVDGQFVVVHVIRPVVGVNLNANLDGSPKTLGYSDATRLRVSSQARKRAMREWMHTFINTDEQATRTRKVPGAAAEALTELRDVTYDDALNAIAALVLGVGKFAMTATTADRTEEIAFVPRQTPTLLAQIANTHWNDIATVAQQIADERAAAIAAAAESDAPKSKGRKKVEKVYLKAPALPALIKKQVVDAYAPGASAEIALSGRMLTGLPESGAVDAASSVAHSYSVDPVRWTYDEWTAKDDWQDGGFDDDKTGAANLGTSTLASGTLYEWASLDRVQLRLNIAETSGLDGDALTAAVHAAEQLFVASAAWAVPTASSHSTGSVAAPTLVVAAVTDISPLTASVFEEAITTDITATAAARLANYLTRRDRRRPLNGGTVLWMPALDTPAPAFPATLTVEEG